MKKLNKLLFNREKIIRGEELVLLRGGYDKENCGMDCSSDFMCFGGTCPKCHVTAGGWPRPMCDSM